MVSTKKYICTFFHSKRAGHLRKKKIILAITVTRWIHIPKMSHISCQELVSLDLNIATRANLDSVVVPRNAHCPSQSWHLSMSFIFFLKIFTCLIFGKKARRHHFVVHSGSFHKSLRGIVRKKWIFYGDSFDEKPFCLKSSNHQSGWP